MMELKIFKGFERYIDGYPEEAVKYALEHREEAVEELLYILRYTIKNAKTLCEDQSYMIHLTAMFLLAYFRETRAYELVIELGHIESELPESLLDYQLYTGYKKVIASVFDGRLDPLKELIENVDADESVRVEALLSLLILLNDSKITREEIVFYIKELLNSKLKEDFSAIWDDIPDICLMLHPGNLMEDVLNAVSSGKILSYFVDMTEFRKQMSRPVKDVLYELKNDTDFTLIDGDDLFLLQIECEELMCEYDEIIDDYYDEDEFDIFDDWGVEFDLIENKDWDGLLEYSNEKLEAYPDNPAYLMGKALACEYKEMYEEAIEILTKLHAEYPEMTEISYTLLDIIYKSGKDEDYISWTYKPEIMKTEKEAVEFCYEFMKKKRKPRDVEELHYMIRLEKYPVFSKEQLAEFLKKDARFLVQDVGEGLPHISVIKKK